MTEIRFEFVLRLGAAGIVLEREWHQRYFSNEPRDDRDGGRCSETEESAAPSAAGAVALLLMRRSALTTCGAVAPCGKQTSSTPPAAGSVLPAEPCSVAISPSSSSLSDCAAVNNQRLHVALIVIREHELRVWRDVERTQ